MKTTTSLTFNEDQLNMLISSLESEWTDYMDEEELAKHDKLLARIVKAINRLD